MWSDLLTGQLRTMARLVPDEPAYRSIDGDRITFGEWERASSRLARGLRDAGIRKGDRVGMLLAGSDVLRWIVIYVAVHKLGAVNVPINDGLSDPEVTRILHHAGPSVIFTTEDRAQAARDAVPTVIAGNDFDKLLAHDDTDVQENVEGEDLADIIYTSGTTGDPKGVVVRHHDAAVMGNTEPVWTGNTWLTTAPLFTFAGLGFIFHPMKLGMTALHVPRFDAARWLDTVETERPMAAFLVPAMAQLLLAHPRWPDADLSSVMLLTLGSAPLPPPTLRALQERLPHALVLNSYGMTEGGQAVFAMDAEGARTKPDSVGKPMPPAEVRIVDENGAPVSAGDVGEIITRNPGRHREYYNDPGATARTWREGWLHTGDLGYLDEDGYLYVVGRTKDLIIRGGMNVYPQDVEAVLHEHPAVREAAVIGVPHPILGEDVAAFVALKNAVTVEELGEFCADRLAKYKVPRAITIVGELPRNAAGKVLKRALVDPTTGGS
jgi:acyl-CoA synthetase (AMP-forming)/AMP-acid ligase II